MAAAASPRQLVLQGADKENSSALIAAEGAQYSADGLVIEGNNARLAPGLGRNPAFVADWTGTISSSAGIRWAWSQALRAPLSLLLRNPGGPIVGSVKQIAAWLADGRAMARFRTK